MLVGIATVVHCAIALRVAFLVALATNSNFVFSQNGFLTADTCVYIVCSVMSSVSSFFGITMVYYRTDAALIYNAMSRVNQNFTGKKITITIFLAWDYRNDN